MIFDFGTLTKDACWTVKCLDRLVSSGDTALFSCHGCAIAPAYGRCPLRVDIMQAILNIASLLRELINDEPPSHILPNSDRDLSEKAYNDYMMLVRHAALSSSTKKHMLHLRKITTASF